MSSRFPCCTSPRVSIRLYDSMEYELVPTIRNRQNGRSHPYVEGVLEEACLLARWPKHALN